MNLKDVLPYVGTSHLRDRVQEAVGEHADELPLEICCLHGGWPEPDRLIVGDIPQPQVDSGEIHVSIPVQFDESVATSCADIAFPEHVSREIPVALTASPATFSFHPGTTTDSMSSLASHANA
jgi:hypothetical protein